MVEHEEITTSTTTTVRAAPDCEHFINHCNSLRCAYGVLKSYDTKYGCERCDCEDPCHGVTCPGNSQCAVDIRSDYASGDTSFVAVCRQHVKPGVCPYIPDTEACEVECDTDANCRGDYKCCRSECGAVCALPADERTTTTTVKAPVRRPETQSPRLSPVRDEDVRPVAREGGVATMKCFATGFPPPTITWKRRGIEVRFICMQF